jgi:hypothetical protein
MLAFTHAANRREPITIAAFIRRGRAASNLSDA